MGHFGLRTFGLRTGVLPLLIQAATGLRTLGLRTLGLQTLSRLGIPDYMDLGLGLAGPPTWPMVPLPDLGTQPWISDWAKRLGARFRTVDFGLGPSLVPRATSREIAMTTFQGLTEIITPRSCAMKEKSEMRWVDFLSVATHPYDFSSCTDSEDPTGSRKLISVLDTHPHVCPTVQCRWDRPHIGTCKTYIPPPFYVLVRVATHSYGHNE